MLIKEITNITREGVSFKLTEKASMNGGINADQWYVSWDKIGRALFGEQYSNTENITKVKMERGEIKSD